MISKIKEQFKKVESVFDNYESFGANDSEPLWIRNDLIKKTIRGEIVILPNGVDDWKLYDKLRSNAAAKSMTSSVKKLITLIKNCPISKLKELKEWVEITLD